MSRCDSALKAILLTIAVFLGIIALRPLVIPETNAHAQVAGFDHVTIIATTFLYKGQQGLLVLDRRNANVWFMPRTGDQFATPVFVLRLPFEKLDEPPK